VLEPGNDSKAPPPGGPAMPPQNGGIQEMQAVAKDSEAMPMPMLIPMPMTYNCDAAQQQQQPYQHQQ